MPEDRDHVARHRAAVAQRIEGRDPGAEQRRGVGGRQTRPGSRRARRRGPPSPRHSRRRTRCRECAGCGNRSASRAGTARNTRNARQTSRRRRAARALQPTTPAPTASITPAISCPGMRGKERPGHCPSTVRLSLWHTPHASMRTRTSPRAGSGTSRSTSSSGPPPRATCTARIFAIAASWLGRTSRFHHLPRTPAFDAELPIAPIASDDNPLGQNALHDPSHSSGNRLWPQAQGPR